MNFFESSYLAMGEIYPDIGPQAAIRALVHQHVAKVRTARAKPEALAAVGEIDFEESKS